MSTKVEEGTLGLVLGALIASGIWVLCTGPDSFNTERRRQSCQDAILKAHPGEVWEKAEPVWQKGYPNLICPVTVIQGPSARRYGVIEAPYKE